MTELEQLQPYLRPDYWDGHAFGDSDAVMHEQVPTRGLLRAGRALQERLNRGSTVFPLETFRDGDTFSPDNYPPGTITLFREDTLYQRGGTEQHTPLVEVDGPIMERRLDVVPFCEPEESSYHIMAGGIQYHSMAWWGMVSADRHGSHFMPKSSVSNVIKTPSGQVELVVPMLVPSDFRGTIGRTTHEMYRDRTERLSRVNILHVVAYGQAQRTGRRLFGLGKLAMR